MSVYLYLFFLVNGMSVDIEKYWWDLLIYWIDDVNKIVLLYVLEYIKNNKVC